MQRPVRGRAAHRSPTRPRSATSTGWIPTQVKVFVLADLVAIKISVPRRVMQGSFQDRDMHAGQQYVPLLGLEVE